jgi:hypothetical protein
LAFALMLSSPLAKLKEFTKESVAAELVKV